MCAQIAVAKKSKTMKTTKNKIVKGLLVLIIGLAICYLSITQIHDETLQMAALSLGALTMIAGGIIMIFSHPK